MKIGLVASDIKSDLMSAELFEVFSERSEVFFIDPALFRIEINQKQNIFLGDKKYNFFDAVVIRHLSRKGNPDFQFETLKQCEDSGLLCINSLKALDLATNKFLTSWLLSRYGLPVPAMTACQDRKSLLKMFNLYGDLVVKPLYGELGKGLYRICHEKDFYKFDKLLETQGAVIVQQFVEGRGKDYRVFVIGDHVIGSIQRRAKRGWITNVLAGGEASKVTLSQDVRDLCVKAAQILGLDYCGVDVIFMKSKPYILELNGSPSWSGLKRATGVSIAEEIVSHILRKASLKKQIPYMAS